MHFRCTQSQVLNTTTKFNKEISSKKVIKGGKVKKSPPIVAKSVSKVVPTYTMVPLPKQGCFIHQTKCPNHGNWWFEGFCILSTWAGATAWESCYSNFGSPCSNVMSSCLAFLRTVFSRRAFTVSIQSKDIRHWSMQMSALLDAFGFRYK